MNYNDVDKIIEKGKKDPKNTLIVLFILGILLCLGAFITNYFGEKGRQLAGEQEKLNNSEHQMSFQNNGKKAEGNNDNIDYKKEIDINPSEENSITGKEKSASTKSDIKESTVKQETHGNQSPLINSGGNVELNYGK